VPSASGISAGVMNIHFLSSLEKSEFLFYYSKINTNLWTIYSYP